MKTFSFSLFILTTLQFSFAQFDLDKCDTIQLEVNSYSENPIHSTINKQEFEDLLTDRVLCNENISLYLDTFEAGDTYDIKYISDTLCLECCYLFKPDLSILGGAIEETKLLYAWSFENYLVDEFHLKIEPIVLYTTQGNYIFFNTATVDEVCNTGWSINAVHVNYCTPITNFTVPSTTICEGEGILFKDASQKVPENWNWYFEGADVPFATEQNSGAFYSTAGVYDVQLITSNPVGSDTLLLKDYITVLPDPNNLVEIQNFDYQINEGESVQLTICDTSDTYIYRWNPPTYLSCSDCPNPIASPPTNVEYTAIIHQVYTSCEMECLHNVVVAGLELIVPTAFSPNADDINDVLKPISSLAEVLRFTVYNRWGQKIYEGAGDSAAWNGTFKNQNAPIGSYVWTVEYLPKNETAPRLEQGFVVLVR